LQTTKNIFFKTGGDINATVSRLTSVAWWKHSITIYQKGTYYLGIKVFNSPPSQIKDLSHNIRQFKPYLKSFLHLHSFYMLEECFNYNKI
jgi:hypothetical protein